MYTEYSSELLSYIGDAAYELAARSACIAAGITDLAIINRVVTAQVCAKAQSAAVEVILPQLTEAETEVYKRGRNRHRVATPKSATAQEYRRATGLECVFGALYLSGEQMRFDTLFALCCTKENLLLAADRAKPAT